MTFDVLVLTNIGKLVAEARLHMPHVCLIIGTKTVAYAERHRLLGLKIQVVRFVVVLNSTNKPLARMISAVAGYQTTEIRQFDNHAATMPHEECLTPA
jgi:hypothetical protein